MLVSNFESWSWHIIYMYVHVCILSQTKVVPAYHSVILWLHPITIIIWKRNCIHWKFKYHIISEKCCIMDRVFSKEKWPNLYFFWFTCSTISREIPCYKSITWALSILPSLQWPKGQRMVAHSLKDHHDLLPLSGERSGECYKNLTKQPQTRRSDSNNLQSLRHQSLLKCLVNKI